MNSKDIFLDHNLILIQKDLGNLYISFITDKFDMHLKNVILSKINIPTKTKTYVLVNLSFLHNNFDMVLKALKKINIFSIGIMGNISEKIKKDLKNLNFTKANPNIVEESFTLKQNAGITRYSFKINSPFTAFIPLLNERLYYKDILPNESYKFKAMISPNKEFILDLYGANADAINKVDNTFVKLNVNNKLLKAKSNHLTKSPENILNLIVSQFFFGEKLGLDKCNKNDVKFLCKKMNELFLSSFLSRIYYISDKIRIKKYDENKYVVHFFENRKTVKLNQDIVDLIKLFDGKKTNKEIYESIKLQYKLSYKNFITYLIKLMQNKIIFSHKTKTSFKEVFVDNDFKYSLDTITFEITKKCNLSCIHCYNNSSPKSSNSKISLQDFEKFVKKIKTIGVFNIVFTGGEPLINPELKKYIIILQKNNLWYSIFTNGTLINHNWISFFKKYPPRRFAISLDTLNKDKHNIIRGVSVEPILKNLKKLTQENFRIRINTTIFANLNDDLLDFFKLFEFLHSTNIFEIAIDPFELEGRGKSKPNLENKNYLDLFKKINLAYYNVFGKNYFDANVEKNNNYCGVAINSLFVRVDGKITLCPLLNDDEHILSNINTSILNLKEMWNHNKLLEYIRNKDYVMIKCKNCKQLEYCYQGCIGKSWQKHRDYKHIDDWACNKAKFINLNFIGYLNQ